MKLFIFTFYVIAFANLVNGAVMGDSAIHAECNSNPTTKLSNEDLDKAIMGETFDRAAFGRHAVCMTTKMGILKENGEINSDLWKEKLVHLGVDAAKADEIIKCAHVSESLENTAMTIMGCVRKHGGVGHVHHHH